MGHFNDMHYCKGCGIFSNMLDSSMHCETCNRRKSYEEVSMKKIKKIKDKKWTPTHNEFVDWAAGNILHAILRGTTLRDAVNTVVTTTRVTEFKESK